VNSKIQGKKHSVSGSGFLYKNMLLTHLRASGTSKKFFGGFAPWTPREGKGKKGRGRERKGKMCPPKEIPAYATGAKHSVGDNFAFLLGTCDFQASAEQNPLINRSEILHSRIEIHAKYQHC
jgi:hypothetical protein